MAAGARVHRLSLNESHRFSDLLPRFNQPKGYPRVQIPTVSYEMNDAQGFHVGQGGATHGGVPWVAATSPELRFKCYGARRLGFTRNKWSRGQGDPYLRVLDGGWGS
jgi:hypothetical protein